MHSNPSAIPILFTHFGDDWIRGSERCLLDLLSHLDRSRFTPVVWCNSPRLAAALAALNAPLVVQLSSFPLLFGWQAPRADWRGYRRLKREGRALIRREQIQLLHANSSAAWPVNFTCRYWPSCMRATCCASVAHFVYIKFLWP